MPLKMSSNYLQNAEFEILCVRIHVTVFSYYSILILYYFSYQPHCVKSFQIWSFSWSVFSHIRTAYRDLLRKSPHPIRIRENKGQKKSPYLDTFHTVLVIAFVKVRKVIHSDIISFNCWVKWLHVYSSLIPYS